MTKENEGERSEHRHVVGPRKRRRISSDDVKAGLESLFVLVQHLRGAHVHPFLLARALRVAATVVGVLNSTEALPLEQEDENGNEP